ncbi:hypothetical protein [Aquicella lusitana]|uniref:Uncharacterized protein n=1 Tax=Aquicella lusitana TaxID=254246 RepID=A0A370GTB2_9COXI|nr:hypothetical protein [Aquicella lusitana]RDI46915.1 hypothetical protein C8D86_10437 [Aquicella lusitana]VVC73806.1 hypothetical protein AQULUS_15550 [Aquicella lusitana]
MRTFITLYAVGASLELNAVAKGAATLLSAAHPQKCIFFLTEGEALFYAKRTSAYDSFGNPATSPVVFEVQVQSSLKPNGNFIVSKIVSGRFFSLPPVALNVTSDQYFKTMPPLICHPDNFKGKWDILKDYANQTDKVEDGYKKLQWFTFLCCNKKGLTTPSNTYHLPKGVDKEICDYVAGRSIGKK